MATKIQKVLDGMKAFIMEGLSNKSKYFYKPGSFTRNRSLPFFSLCCFILCNKKKSLSIELDDFFLEQGHLPCTKGAFSKSRYRVRWEFYRDWCAQSVRLIYDQFGRRMKKWKGFYLKGVDGSTLYLFDEEDVIKEFGGNKKQCGMVAAARIGIETDLLNGYCTQSWLGPYWQGEAVFAHEFLLGKGGNDLSVYDRNFSSFELIYKHLAAGSPFVMRAKVKFNSVVEHFVKSGKKQAVVEFSITKGALFMLEEQGYAVDKDTKVRVRLLRIDIGGDEPEVLITSLLDLVRYPHKEFSELYSMRWGCETQVEVFKNKLQTEIFSGHKPMAIYQDFYATVIVLNLHNLILESCEKDLVEINEHRNSEVAINNNVSIGHLKTRLLKLFTTQNTKAILLELQNLFLSHLETVKPNRSFPRKMAKKRNRSKYQTQMNYRRAF
jgi:hypothetical protein